MRKKNINFDVLFEVQYQGENHKISLELVSFHHHHYHHFIFIISFLMQHKKKKNYYFTCHSSLFTL